MEERISAGIEQVTTLSSKLLETIDKRVSEPHVTSLIRHVFFDWDVNYLESLFLLAKANESGERKKLW